MAADSLVLAGLFELLGGGVPSNLPMCSGAIFRLGNQYDMGTPQPVVDFLVSLMGDGSRPVGWRYDNRTFTLPVTIIVPTTGNSIADRLTLAGAREALMQAIAVDEFTLQWSPDGSDNTLNTIFECWRAKAATITYDIKQTRQLISELTVTFDAMPFGRSDTLSYLSFDSPVVGVAPAVSQVVVDDFTSVSSSTNGTLWSASAVTPYGTQSARWSHNLSNGLTPLLYTHTLGVAQDISGGRNKLTFWLGLGADSQSAYRGWKKGLVHFAVVLKDNLGRSLTCGVQQVCNASSNSNWPVWNRVSMSIPQGATFTYSNVVSYSIQAWTDLHTLRSGRFLELRHTGYLAGLLATPTSAPKRPASDRGGEYLLYGTEGTAPTPLNLHLQLGFQSLTPTTQTLLLSGQPGTAQSFTAPPENPNWLYGDASNGEKGTIGTWTGSDGAATNSTIANSTTLAHGGTHSITVVPVTGGSNALIASTVASNIQAAGVPCAAGDRIALRTWVRAGSTTRSITVAAEFYNSGGTSIGSVALTPVTDSASAWTQINGRVTAPANAAWCRMLMTVATPAAGEIHYFDDIYLSWAVQATVIGVGAGGAGGSCNPNWTAAAGGSAGETAWETNLDLNPAAGHAYQIGAGGVWNLVGARGGDGSASTFAGLSVTVTANGGLGGPNTLTTDNTQSSGSGATSGSTNTHHFNGGNGGPGNHQLNGWPVGGGGGGAASDGGAGNAGGTPAGGAPGATGSLNIPGGQGGAGQNNHGGSGNNGVFPGGGGGGASCQIYAHSGGNGANGMIKMIITTYTSKQTFPAVLVHKLSAKSGIRARVVVPVGSANDTPDGREYVIDNADGVPARYEGTYSVAVVNWSWNGSTARTVTATLRQREAAGGAVSSYSVSQSVTPANISNGIAWLGEVTLPLKDMPAENTDSYFTAAVTSGNTSDRFLDLLLVDTAGQVILVNLPGSGYSDYYFDAPDIQRDVGLVLGTMTDRSAAVSVMANSYMSGGPMRLTPGDNVFTVYSPTGQPALEGDFWPRWWQERLS